MSFIDSWIVFLNNIKISSYSEEVKDGDLVKITWILPLTKISSNGNKEKKLLILNKPEWVIVSKSNNQGKNVYDVLPEKYKNRYYIWRLDKNSCWLLLFANDSALVNEYSHPSKKIEKEYEVITNRRFTNDEINKSLKWIVSLEDKLSFKRIEFIWSVAWKPDHFLYKVYLEEWKNRHIRRVFDYFWMKVLILKRIREGDIVLWDMKIWNYKELNLL